MLWGGREAFSTFGWSFITSSDWDAVQHKFGALVPIYGTLVTALIAMLIAVPVSFGIALFLTEVAPAWMRGPVAAGIELLAGIPSIIYGMWGLFVFVPFMAANIIPWLNAHVGPWPLIGPLLSGPPLGIGMLTAGIVLAIMVIPFITAVMRDVFLTVPTRLKESAYALVRQPGRSPGTSCCPHAHRGGSAVFPRSWPRTRRNDGGDLRARKFAPTEHVAADAGQLDRRDAGQRIH
jgi:phosphate transport system permease protein